MSESDRMAGPVGVVALVLAGGAGSRFGAATPKQLINLAGQPVLFHTLRKLEHVSAVKRVVIAANPNWVPQIQEIAEFALRQTPFMLVDGGGQRNDSVRSAVQALADAPDETRLLIHDSVRPLASIELIESVALRLNDARCVLPVIPSADPLVRVTNGMALSFEKRSEVYRGQSPQGFVLADLRRAFESLPDPDRFETVFELVRSTIPDLQIHTVEGELNNIKITTPVDRVIAGRLLLDE